MRATLRTLLLLFIVLSLTILSGGCGGSSGSDTTSEEVENGDGGTDDGGETGVSDSFLVTGPSYTINGKVVHITGGGEYTAEGTLDDGQIAVNAVGENVVLILDGVAISNSNGPAILALSAASLRIVLADGSVNVLSDGGGNEDYDATIFSSVPLVMDGGGELVVVGNYQEGIASDSTLTIEDGNIWITATDDGLNSGADMTINGGYIYIEAVGDGVDSNANLAITGGTVISIGGMEGGDGGLDIDDGFTFTLSGGTVIATGNTVVEPPNGSGMQISMLMNYQSAQAAGTIVHIEGSSLGLSYEPGRSYQSFFFSSPLLATGDYAVYAGGSDSGTKRDGLYESDTYTGGTAMTHSGSADGVFSVTSGRSNSYHNVGADQSGSGSGDPGQPGQPGEPGGGSQRP